MASSWANIASDISGSLNNVLENALVTRAVLVFPGVRPENVEKEEVKATAGAAVGGVSLAGAGNMLGAAQSNLGGLANALNEAAEGVTGLKVQLPLDGMLSSCYKVQFNPSNLQIRAVGGGRFAITDYGTKKPGDTSMERGSMKPHITISFRIVVDETNNADAFMADKFSLSASGIVQKAGTLAAVAIGGKEFSVRPQVEGFLGAVRSTYNRAVIFQWGKMRYAGILNGVQTRYTMFSTSGNPIRAEIDVTLQSASTNNEAMLTFWKKRYKDIMNELKTEHKDGTVSATTTNLTNTMTNFLNL